MRGNLFYIFVFLALVVLCHITFAVYLKQKGEPIRGLMRFPKLEICVVIIVSTGLFESCVSTISSARADSTYFAVAVGFLVLLALFNIWFFSILKRKLVHQLGDGNAHAPAMFVEKRCILERGGSFLKDGASIDRHRQQSTDAEPMQEKISPIKPPTSTDKEILLNNEVNKPKSSRISGILQSRASVLYKRQPEIENDEGSCAAHYMTWRETPHVRKIWWVFFGRNVVVGEWLAQGSSYEDAIEGTVEGHRIIEQWGPFFSRLTPEYRYFYVGAFSFTLQSGISHFYSHTLIGIFIPG